MLPNLSLQRLNLKKMSSFHINIDSEFLKKVDILELVGTIWNFFLELILILKFEKGFVDTIFAFN